MEVVFGKQSFYHHKITDPKDVTDFVLHNFGLDDHEFYLISNGKRVHHESILSSKIYVMLRIPGGKGGFGSMLRAIGAQIEKTTNREACRDLSGRRLRDINEEQRLKKWVAEQAEREKEAKEKKKKKLERLLEQPKHTFVDQEYDKERSALPEKVEDAVLKGLEASCSTKRKCEDIKSKAIKKKPKLWIDSELDEDLSSSDCESENEDEHKETHGDRSNQVLEADNKLEKEENSHSDNSTTDRDDPEHPKKDLVADGSTTGESKTEK